MILQYSEKELRYFINAVLALTTLERRRTKARLLSVLFYIKGSLPFGNCFIVKMFNVREEIRAGMSLFPSLFPGLDLLRTWIIL